MQRSVRLADRVGLSSLSSFLLVSSLFRSRRHITRHNPRILLACRIFIFFHRANLFHHLRQSHPTRCIPLLLMPTPLLPPRRLSNCDALCQPAPLQNDSQRSRKAASIRKSLRQLDYVENGTRTSLSLLDLDCPGRN
jgi:hypothetical protein